MKHTKVLVTCRSNSEINEVYANTLPHQEINEVYANRNITYAQII